MGKTKLLWEYKRQSMVNHGELTILILSTASLTASEKRNKTVFDVILDLDNILPKVEKARNSIIHKVSSEQQQEDAKHYAHRIFSHLDQMLLRFMQVPGRKNVTKVALFFDEAQHFLMDEFGYKAFRFRCVRIWLREQRDYTVVAVFAGTNSKLTNFLFETDEELKLPSDRATSRPLQHSISDKVQYYEKGSVLYPPFYRTTTAGSCLPLLNATKPKKGTVSEYERAVYYGRPLFALLAKNEELAGSIQTVLYRMLWSHKWSSENKETSDGPNAIAQGNQSDPAKAAQDIQSDPAKAWSLILLACINLLATRIQMGHTSALVASELVANSYTNFLGYIPDSESVLLGYYPDPVCARLAMCMMDETYEHVGVIRAKTRITKGESKKWWTQKLQEIFSSGIVSPDKGNLGEVVVALYMLFCGDLLRKETDKVKKSEQRYTQFSVSMDNWLQLMVSGGDLPPERESMECSVSVGFIQVCRNPLRSYVHSWHSLTDECFLKFIYESGIAFYTCNNCPLIDLVVPLRINAEGPKKGFEYCPMLISIKCHADFTDNEAKTECKKMEDRARKDHLEKAFCLLIVFGSRQTDPFSDYESRDEYVTTSELLRQKKVIVQAIRVPLTDTFGLSHHFNDMIPQGRLDSELLASHTFLMGHQMDGKSKNDPFLEAEKAFLYSHVKSSTKQDFISLKEAMAPAVGKS